jgi:hypothetical protein
MRYLMTTKASSTPPGEELFAAMDAFIADITASGNLVATGGLDPAGVRMTSQGDDIQVTDGPFLEAKEAIVGFALIEAASKDEALELARRFRRIVGDGESMIHEVFGP